MKTGKMISILLVSFLTVAMGCPAWGYPLAKETLAPKQVEGSPAVMGDIRSDLTSADGGDRLTEERERERRAQMARLEVEIGQLEGALARFSPGSREADDFRERLAGKERTLERLRSQSARDGGNVTIEQRIAELKRAMVDNKTAIGINREDAETITDLTARNQEIEVQIRAFMIGQDIFQSADQGLVDSVMAQANHVEAPVVLGWDPLYFAWNLDAYVRLWKHIRAIPDFGKPGKSGIVTVLLPYSMQEGAGLVGMEGANLPKALEALNAFAKKHTGEDVDLSPSDFGVVVRPELLVDVEQTEAYIEAQTGGHPLTRIFARREVAEAFKALKSLVALVFDLPFEDKVGIDMFEQALVKAIEEGHQFIDPDTMSVEGETAERVRALRATVTQF